MPTLHNGHRPTQPHQQKFISVMSGVRAHWHGEASLYWGLTSGALWALWLWSMVLLDLISTPGRLTQGAFPQSL